ncbi:hypothetical protein EDF88_3929 [Buttiauxella sp. BIGb0552]|uniref:hypothetical protein n=1 Tax=Buttiauxella sp. BIGb0552 TaxID=2485120 RepID=UPI001066ED5C|nr:hypothetical protein [Buttiauxella sp. BIGb0552]TDX14612.1 hypothetical protein EDF88_3929 [Buttiauxella sp. BIGb0552]
MTAEIAVFNRYGIALAADSAVTTTVGFSEKIYNNADKLFELSKDHPVAIMIYNNAALCGAPWELLIKTFRKTLSTSPLSTIEDYGKAFFNYVKSNKKIITDEMQEDFLKAIYCHVILPGILRQVQDQDVANFLQAFSLAPTTEQYHAFIETRARQLFATVDSNDFFDDFDQSDFNLAKQYIASFILEICSNCIAPDMQNGNPDYSAGLIDSLIDLFAVYTCKNSDLGTYSGIVIAGFGEDEYYPVVQSHHVYGIFNNKLMIPATSNQNNSGTLSGIMPFAQDDEVHTFMRGCSKGITGCIHDSLNNAFSNMKVEVTNIIASQNPAMSRVSIEAAFDAVIPSQIAYTNTMIDNHATQNHIQKVLSILDSLAKVDLGYMAESLVNLTAFKRKVSNDSDSVGGPIDVAVLSKGDGLVWLKRKHYFDKELNYRFFNRK